MSVAWVIGASGLCLLLYGALTGAELALLSADGERLRQAAAEGHRGAGVALDLRAREERLQRTRAMISGLAVLCAVTLILSWLLPRGMADAAWGLGALVLGFAFVEGAARLIHLRYADPLAPRLAGPLRGIQRAIGPLLSGLEGLQGWLAERLGLDPQALQREDIVELLDDPGHALPPDELRLIQRIMGITDLTAAQCMTPLIDVRAVPLTATVADAIDRIVRHGISRLPVYEGRVDNIVGLLHHRDLLHGPADHAPIRGLMHPVPFVPDSKGAGELLREMRQGNQPLAVVVDEYGGTVGIVSQEDVLEEILGDIADERDEAPPAIRALGAGQWRVPARAEIDALERALGRPAPEGDFATVGGLILAATGRIPEPGEIITVGPLRFEVEQASERAIHTVRVSFQD